jgi:hypothetical protein
MTLPMSYTCISYEKRVIIFSIIAWTINILRGGYCVEENGTKVPWTCQVKEITAGVRVVGPPRYYDQESGNCHGYRMLHHSVPYLAAKRRFPVEGLKESLYLT